MGESVREDGTVAVVFKNQTTNIGQSVNVLQCGDLVFSTENSVDLFLSFDLNLGEGDQVGDEGLDV